MAAILVLAATPAAAYYHYVHYLNSASPYQVVFEKFDVTALPDQTVTFFVSNSGPTSYTTNDGFPSLLEQIRNATKVWNAVTSSGLRVAFGGLQAAGTNQTVPTGEVVFDDQIPPGVLAYALHQVSANGVASAADGTQFVPIVLSQIHLNSNLTPQSGAASSEGFTGPSYSESFFMTLVHEIGHAIGLQHTYTSATMSTAVSRATNRSLPLDKDDIAGVSLLYPAGGFPAGYGSISGQVTMSGQGVHMASVVAILPNGSAVSNLTNPDGSYEIDGLPPGNYWVYVHPLPPTANITLPLGPDGITQVAPSAPFVSTFYSSSGGTWNPAQFTPITIAQGASQGGIDFSVQPRSAVEVFDVTSYWYPASEYPGSQPGYLQPAYLNASNANPTAGNGQAASQAIAQGTGITYGTDSTNVQSVVALGAPGGPLQDYSAQAYQDSDANVAVTLLAMFFNYPSPPPIGPEHLLFTLPDDIFVLPQALQVVPGPPPLVTAVTQNQDGSVTVAGTGLTASSQVFFDSLPGQVTAAYAANPADTTGQSGSVSVMPPPGPGGQTSTIAVYNPDGQNSTFLQSQTPGAFTYAYPPSDPPAANISISQLPQGVSAMVDITTSSMQFCGTPCVDGLTTVGFGSGDIAVRRLWVLSPTHAVANVTVSPSALQQETVASVISGFQVYEQGLGFQVVPANPNLPLITLPVVNYSPVQNSLYAGTNAVIYGQNLVVNNATPAISVAGIGAQVFYSSPTQVYFVIPAQTPTGPVELDFNNGATKAFPLVLQIDPPPLGIANVLSAASVALGAAQSATTGETITLIATGLNQAQAAAVVLAPNRIGVVEGGVTIPVFTVQQAQDNSGDLLIAFVLDASITGQQVPLTVTLDGDLSLPYFINISTPAPSAPQLRASK